MAKKKRANRHKVPRSAIQNKILGTQYAMILVCTVLFDKFGFSQDEMCRFWEQLEKYTEEIAEKRINPADLAKVLRDDYGIIVGL